MGWPSAVAGALMTLGAAFTDNFEAYTVGQPWAPGQHGGWQVVFTGYGVVQVEADGSKALTLRPMASTQPGETHAALVVSASSFGDVDLTLRMKTVAQLRTGSAANPWEVAWAFWHYTDNTHFYYLALKPNGWELGKADPAYPGSQRFLATGSGRTFPVGGWYAVRVRQVGGRITVWVDGVQLVVFRDRQRAYLYGAVGLYSEDAVVRFDDVAAKAP